MKRENLGLYDFNIITVKQLGDHLQKITQLSTYRIPGQEKGTLEMDSRAFLLDKPIKPRLTNDTKLDNNITRARTQIKEIVLCNEWDYWCTLTIDPKMLDRYELEGIMKAIKEFIHNYNRRCDDKDKVKYLLVPEQHKDGAWHLHGFIKGIKKKDLYINKHGYLTWKQYEQKFGFISMDTLRDRDRASSYITKYLSKDLSRSIQKVGGHLYYVSQGLNRPELIFRGNAELCNTTWDYEHPDGYCKIKTIDTRKTDLSEVLELI